MSQLAQSAIALNNVLSAHGINQNLLCESLHESVEVNKAVLKGAGRVLTNCQRLHIESKVHTVGSLLILLELTNCST
jgi:hypothetical protein